ncbi:MAG: hypothetical protein GKC10_07960 [Methanosarcinales archaeon]|nr:hypothetical protein [Methanosarcinales archaeon]
MLFFAHLGLTMAAASPFKRASMAFVALGSMLPDIIDKPLGYLVYGTPAMGRTVAHTLLFLLILAMLSYGLNSNRLGSLSGGVMAHLTLDSIWQTPIIFLWPLLGPFPADGYMSVTGYIETLLRGLENPYILIPEVLGFLLLIPLLAPRLKKVQKIFSQIGS